MGFETRHARSEDFLAQFSPGQAGFRAKDNARSLFEAVLDAQDGGTSKGGVWGFLAELIFMYVYIYIYLFIYTCMYIHIMGVNWNKVNTYVFLRTRVGALGVGLKGNKMFISHIQAQHSPTKAEKLGGGFASSCKIRGIRRFWGNRSARRASLHRPVFLFLCCSFFALRRSQPLIPAC